MSGKHKGRSGNISSEHITRDSVITVGDYFFACCRFLSENNFSILKTGLETVFKRSVQTDQISKIAVFLEKHGAFYHPLKIQVDLNESCTGSFVMNGAVSKPGLALIENEYYLISGLNKGGKKLYLPRVFGIDFVKTDKGRIGFFLGEWFDGYNEFHITQDPDGRQIVIWESDGSFQHILEADALQIYQEISRILTYYYDIETFEQIFPWHHAAGDFIVKKEEGDIHVRLITVRGYSPLSQFDAADEDKNVHILPSLMFFCLNLTIRMRIDRLDGTGQAVMLGKKMIKATIKGFLQSLDEKSADYDFGNLRLIFIAFFQQFNLEQVMGIMKTMLESSHPDPLESALIEKNLESHCKLLLSIFKNF